MQEIFVNIFYKFDFERQKMAEEKQGGKIITPLGWENNSQNLKVNLTQRSNKKADSGATRGVLSWAEFQKSDEFKAIKRQKMPNGKWQFVPNNEQLRKLVRYEEVSLGEIDTSEVTDMKGLFAYIEHDFWEDDVDWAKDNNVKLDFKREDFSGIGSWDTSKVTTFERMFCGATNFNQPLDSWDTSKVTDMSGMFDGALEFNEDISGWDTSKVTNMSRMFCQAWIFNQPLDKWDTSNTTNMSGMFDGANEFNEDISGWDTSKVTDMSGMFRGAENFNQPLDRWDTSKVTNMSGMFLEAGNFNQPLNSWDISKVTNMSSMFRGAENFNQPLDRWDTSSVTNMCCMFLEAGNFNQPLNSWDISKVTDMSGMFWGAINFNQPLNSWDISKVTDMSGMFMNTTNFNQNLSAWGKKLDKVKNMSSMFSGAKSLICDFFSWWETSEVCDLKDRIKDSGVEKLRDARKKIKNETGYITKEQRVELAQILGLDEKELKIINEPALSNFDIYKVVVNEENFLKSILPYEGEGEKVVKNWLVKDVAYRVYLLRYNERNDEFTQDKSEWDFAFCKVFESWFMIKKNSRLRNNGNEKLPPQLNEALLLFRIYQGRDMNELEKQSKRKFNKDKEYISQNRELTIYFEQIAMHILDGGVDFSNQKIVQDIVYAVVLAKAYNIKMENLRDTAKESANDTKRLKECYKEVCDFDLKKYYSIPITQNGKDSNANVVLMEVWHYISNVCFVTQQHDELKDVIAQMSRVLTDDKRDSQSWWFSVAAVAIAFVSFVVAAISAMPVIEKWLG